VSRTEILASAATDEPWQITMMYVRLCQFLDETLARIQFHGILPITGQKKKHDLMENEMHVQR